MFDLSRMRCFALGSLCLATSMVSFSLVAQASAASEAQGDAIFVFDAESPVAEELLQSSDVTAVSEDIALVEDMLQDVDVLHVYNDHTGEFEGKTLVKAGFYKEFAEGLAEGAVIGGVSGITVFALFAKFAPEVANRVVVAVAGVSGLVSVVVVESIKYRLYKNTLD